MEEDKQTLIKNGPISSNREQIPFFLCILMSKITIKAKNLFCCEESQNNLCNSQIYSSLFSAGS